MAKLKVKIPGKYGPRTEMGEYPMLDVELDEHVTEVIDNMVSAIMFPDNLPASKLILRGNNVLRPGVDYTMNGVTVTFTPTLSPVNTICVLNLIDGSLAWRFSPVDGPIA